MSLGRFTLQIFATTVCSVFFLANFCFAEAQPSPPGLSNTSPIPSASSSSSVDPKSSPQRRAFIMNAPIFQPNNSGPSVPTAFVFQTSPQILETFSGFIGLVKPYCVGNPNKTLPKGQRYQASQNLLNHLCELCATLEDGTNSKPLGNLVDQTVALYNELSVKVTLTNPELIKKGPSPFFVKTRQFLNQLKEAQTVFGKSESPN